MTKGYFAFVLHMHLPYVLSHGRWPHGMDWLSEAAAETYLPLIKIMNELIVEGAKPKLTVDISPVLTEQLADDTFKDEFRAYLKQKTKAAREDAREFRKYGQKDMLVLAHFWEKFYGDSLNRFEAIDGNIINELKKLQDSGYLEILTCGATHGYYPLLSRDESLQVQTKLAVKNYEKHFGRRPRGIWLPECGYRPRYTWHPPVEIEREREGYLRKGAEEFLAENGLEFFVVDTVLLKGGESVGAYIARFEALKKLWHQFEDAYEPRPEDTEKSPYEVYLVNSGGDDKNPVGIFARDAETGILVWSGEWGYPGDSHYLEFHKKRFPGGLRYWAVTSPKSDLGEKVEYDYDAAIKRIPENAAHFAQKVHDQLAAYHNDTGKTGILTAPYDAELFGHWWFEGPYFLKEVIRNISNDKDIESTFLGEHYDRVDPSEVISISEGSWGQGGHHYIWLNEDTEWTWKHIYECERKMHELAVYYIDHKDTINPELTDIMKQAARELLLMSASDWQFLISSWAARDYAELRLTKHYSDFCKLSKMAEQLIDGENLSAGEWEFLADCKIRDNLFEEIELEWFARVEFPA